MFEAAATHARVRCIFCKCDASDSRSVEHIIPESMGNAQHVLPPGVVCHSCNQYFARKVERPILESPMFLHIRSGMEVPNKRGRIPNWLVGHGLRRPDYRQMSRFLCKVGLEILAFRTLAVSCLNDEIVDTRELDQVRQFARFNVGNDWPFTTRTIHPINEVFVDGETQYELLNEFDILLTGRLECFSVVSLFGVEFVINLPCRDLDGYRVWLEANDFKSPLYVGKNRNI
jgi:hypothetical protein